MKEKYTPPKFQLKAFHCPQCQVYAVQEWNVLAARSNQYTGPLELVPDLDLCICAHCHRYSVWHAEVMIFPESTGVQPVNEDLTEEIIADYNEAASIVQKSPRGAAALLRLIIQKLCVSLGEKGKKIDDDIASLVKKGLPVEVQQALDILRVIGNESVHPGELDLKDDVDTATQLFGLVNLIAEDRITRPKQVAVMYSALPASKLKGIADRDKKP